MLTIAAVHELVSPKRAREMSGGISESTMHRLIKAGDFPRPIVLSRNKRGKAVRVAFVLADLVERNKRIIRADRMKPIRVAA